MIFLMSSAGMRSFFPSLVYQIVRISFYLKDLRVYVKVTVIPLYNAYNVYLKEVMSGSGILYTT